MQTNVQIKINNDLYFLYFSLIISFLNFQYKNNFYSINRITFIYLDIFEFILFLTKIEKAPLIFAKEISVNSLSPIIAISLF